jgi:hypothetical protein
MIDEYQYSDTQLKPKPSSEIGFGVKSGYGLGATSGNNPNASGSGAAGGGLYIGGGGFNPPLPPSDQYVVFNPPTPNSGSGSSIGSP